MTTIIRLGLYAIFLLNTVLLTFCDTNDDKFYFMKATYDASKLLANCLTNTQSWTDQTLGE